MLTVIVGTNRPESASGKIGNKVKEIYGELGVPVKVLNLADLPPEIFDPSAYAEKPASFKPFSQAVLDAEGLIVISPEYNGSMPGVLKYFIDMLEFPESFDKRPVCFIGVAAGMWGALRSVEQLQMIFGYRNAHLFPERNFLARVYELIDDDGNLTDEGIVKRLTKQAAGFVEFVEKLKSIQLKK